MMFFYKVYLRIEASRLEFAIQIHEASTVEPFPLYASFPMGF